MGDPVGRVGNIGLFPCGLLLLLCVFFALLAVRPSGGELDIHDRQVDLIVGSVLLVLCWLVGRVAVHRYGPVYGRWGGAWVCTALFVGGTVALMGGVRLLWRQRGALLLLGLVGPVAGMRVVPQLLAVVSALVCALWLGLPGRGGCRTDVQRHPGPGAASVLLLVVAAAVMGCGVGRGFGVGS